MYGPLVDVGRGWLFMELQQGGPFSIRRPKARITLGAARLVHRGGRFSGRFRPGTPALHDAARARQGPEREVMQGIAFRIQLSENRVPCDLGSLRSPDIKTREEARLRLLRDVRPAMFLAFQALNQLFDAYRLTKFSEKPIVDEPAYGEGPWVWMDPGLPETFGTFLQCSYAVLRSGRTTFTEAGFLPKTFSADIPGVFMFPRSVRRTLTSPSDRTRLTMLDAWTALYEGNTRVAIVLGTAALEGELRNLLLRHLAPGGRGAPDKELDELLKESGFSTQVNVLLPLAGHRLALRADVLKDCTELRTLRAAMLHRGARQPVDWQRAQKLLLSAEDAFAALRAQSDALTSSQVAAHEP